MYIQEHPLNQYYNKTCNFTYSISTFSVISTIHPSNNQVLVDRAASVKIFYLVTSKFVEVFVENASIKFGMYNVDQPSQAINRNLTRTDQPTLVVSNDRDSLLFFILVTEWNNYRHLHKTDIVFS